MPRIDVAIGASKAKQGADVYSRSVQSIVKGSKSAAVSVRKLEARMDRLATVGGKTKLAMIGLFSVIGISGTVFIRKGVSSLAAFEESMKVVAAVSRATGSQLKKLTDLAKQQGATTKFSASQAADGLLFLSRAGFSVKESLVALAPTLDLAISGQLDLGRAADIVSNVLAQFNLTAKDTARAGDILVITANRSNTDVLQLADALKFAGPIAGALGLQLEETAASIGVLGNAGIQSSQAGTTLRGVMLALISPTTKAARTLAKMGLSLSDVDLSTSPLIDVMKKLGDAQLTAKQANDIFGRRIAAGALILSKNSKAMQELTDAAFDFRGEADRVAREMENTIIGAFLSLKSVLEGVAISMGNSKKGLGKVLRNLIDTLTGTIRTFIGLQSAVEKDKVAVAILVTSIQDLSVAFSAFLALKVAVSLGEITVAMKSVALETVVFSKTVQAEMAAAGKSVLLFSSIVASPFRLLGALITAITSFEIGRFISAKFEGVRNAADAFVAEVKVIFNRLKFDVLIIIQDMKKAGIVAIDFVGTKLLQFKSKALGIFSDILDVFVNVSKRIPSKFGTLLSIGTQALSKQLKDQKELLDKTLAGTDKLASKRKQEIIDINKQIDALRKSKQEKIDAINLELLLLRIQSKADQKLAPDLSKKGIADFFLGAAFNTTTDIEQKLRELEKAKKDLEDFEKKQDAIQRKKNRGIVILGPPTTPSQQKAPIASLADRQAAQAIKFEIFPEKRIRAEKQAIRSLFRQGLLSEQTLEAKFKLLDKELDKTGDTGNAAFKVMLEALDGFSRKISETFADIVLTGKASFRDLAESISKSFLQISLDELILNPLLQQFSDFITRKRTSNKGGLVAKLIQFGQSAAPKIKAKNEFVGPPILPSALGNVFGSGGIISQPVTFPLGLAGESGPEAIVPLRRGKDGALGISSNGNSRSNITINMNITTPNADSFRRTKSQIVSDLGRAIKSSQDKRESHSSRLV